MPETPNGIGELENSVLTSMIFPNPFSDEATLTIEGEINGYCTPTVHVFDLTGKEVLTKVMNGNTVKIQRNELAKGTYVYQVLNNEVSPLAKGKFTIR